MDKQTSALEIPPVDVNPPSNRSALGMVILVVIIDLLGFGIVLPLLPRIADQYVVHLVPEGTNHKVFEGTILGLLMASFSFMQFLFAPVWGRISDRVGRRPILLLGLAGSVIFYALLGYGCWLPREQAGLAIVLFFVARIGAGIAGATIGTAQAVIADCTPPEKRKHGMALIGAAFGIGFTFGPLFGYGALTWYPETLAMVGFTAAGLSLLALLVGILLLPETRRFGAEPSLPRRGWNLGALGAAVGDPAIGPIVLVFFLSTLGFGSFEVTLALFLNDVMGFPENQAFLAFAYIGFTLLVAQGFIYRRLAKYLSEVTFMVWGILFMALGVGLLSMVCFQAYQEYLKFLPYIAAGTVDQVVTPLVPNPFSAVPFYLMARPETPWLFVYLMLLSLTVAVLGFAFLTPSALALISRRADVNKQGEVLGINQSASALARILGPLVGIPLYKLTDSHLLPYIFGVGLLLLMLPLMPRIKRG